MNSGEIEEFRKKVKEWIDIDNEINKLNSSIKELKNKKINLNSEILEFMKDNNIEDISTKQCKLKTYTSTTQKGINKEYINKKINNFLKDDDKANELTKIILSEREKKTTTKLKRINNKVNCGEILNLN